MKNIETILGFPLVNAGNVFYVLADLGIKAWPLLEPPITLDAYRARNLNAVQRKELDRFSPKIEVAVFQNPDHEPFASFRPRWHSNNGTHVFTLLPGDLLPVAAAFRHGAEVISLILPGGMLEKNDVSLAWRAKKEFEDETGIMLASVQPLTTEWDSGTPLSAQQMPMRSSGFLGKLRLPLVINSQKLEEREFLKIILIPLTDWLKLIYSGQVQEASPIVTTFLALHKLGRLDAKRKGRL